MAGRWRNLISRLMSLLIAHPSPRRLFIGADRDRPWLVAVPFLPLRSSSLPSPIPFIQPPRPARGGKRKRKNIDPLGGEGEKGRRRFHRSARFIADTSLVFLSCHRTTRSYIFQRQTFPTIPLHPRVYRVYRSLLTSDRCGDPRVQVSSIVTGVDTVSLLLDDLSSLRDPRLLLSAAKHNRHVSHLRAS